MASIFNNPVERRPRAGWRLLLQSMLFAVLLVIGSIVMVVALGPGTAESVDALMEPAPLLAQSVMMLAAVSVSVAVAVRRFDRRASLAGIGVRARGAARDAAFGLVLGAALVALIGGVLVAAGWATLGGVGGRTLPGTAGWLASITLVTLAMAAIAAAEELLSRGYHLTNIAEGLHGPLGARGAITAAIVLSSAVFGVAHVINPGATALGIANVFLAGIALAVAYVVTGSLALAFGWHLGWNLAYPLLLGMPVSGLDPGLGGLMQIEPAGPDAVTGGAFGPEGGLLATGAVIVSAGAFVLYARRRGYAAEEPWRAIAAPPAELAADAQGSEARQAAP